MIGSRQFTDAARVVLSVIVEGRDDSPTGGTGIRRWLASAKNNLTKDPEALSFFITGDDDVDEASTIVWSYAKDANADELADDIEAAQQAQRGTARKTAADLLRKRCIALWTDGADVITAEELEALRLEADVSVSTWSKAKQDCGIKTGHNDQHDGWSAPLAGLDFLPKRPGQQEDDVNIIDPGPWWEQERKRRSRTRTRRARNAG